MGKMVYNVMWHDSKWDWEPDLLSYTAADSSFDITNWLCEHAPPKAIHVDKEIATEFAQSGSKYFDVLKWLCERNYEFSDDAVDKTVQNEDLDADRCLYAFKAGSCTSNAMQFAASRENLDLVAFLHENYTPRCADPSAMDAAAQYGHLDVVRFLHFNRTEGCTSAAMNGAAKEGPHRDCEISSSISHGRMH